MGNYNSTHTGSQIDNFDNQINTLQNQINTLQNQINTLETNLQNQINTLLSKHTVQGIIYDYNTTYINSTGGGNSVLQIDKIVVASLNFRTSKQIPSDTVIASGLPPARHKSQIICQNGASTYAGNLWINTDGTITNDGAMGAADIWFDGTGTYIAQ